ncbi:MAG: winged helix-turn-helix transcriptional regulator [bacterium]
MDAIDVGILRAMGVRPYERTPKPLDALQPSRIARVTGSSVNTVKDRITRMTETGVIAGYQAVPNLRHLGLQGEAYHLNFTSDAAKDAAMPRLLAVDGLLELHDFLGQGACADFAFKDHADLQRTLATISAGSQLGAPRHFYSREMPEVKRSLTPLDWRIVQALRADPRATPADLAPAIGVSTRTVKRHLTRMAAEGSLFLVPMIDPSKADGVFLFELLVHLREGTGPRPMAALRAAFHAEHVYAYVPASAELGNFDLLLFARTSAEVEALRRRAEEIDGVVRAEAWLFRAFLGFPTGLDAAIERASRGLEPAPAAVSSKGQGDAKRRPLALKKT